MHPEAVAGAAAGPGRWSRPLAWWRRPGFVDARVVVAVALLGALAQAGDAADPAAGTGPLGDPRGAGLAAAVLGAQLLWWRRSRPETVTAALALAVPVLGWTAGPQVGGALVLAALAAVYALGAYVPEGRTRWAVAVLAAAGGTVHPVDPGVDPVADRASTVVAVVAALAVGRAVGLRRAYVQQLRLRAEGAALAAEAEARAAVAEERARIARELHDVVAHHVSVMTVQAAAARRVLDRDPASAREAMGAVEGTGRAALVEMRRMVSALREPDEQAPTAPAAGLDALGGLVAQVRGAGLHVDLAVRSDPSRGGAPLPRDVGAAVYRVAQEGLTNVLRHAGADSARVTVDVGPGGVEVAVLDRGTGPRARPDGPARPPVRGGHGLAGMGERVALLGGSLASGPRPGGGWELRARLPLDPGRPLPDGPPAGAPAADPPAAWPAGRQGAAAHGARP